VNLGFRVYFVVSGLGLLAASIALLIDFRGIGIRWDGDVYAHSKEVNRLTHMPWSAKPATGRVWRPYGAIFGIVVSIVLILKLGTVVSVKMPGAAVGVIPPSGAVLKTLDARGDGGEVVTDLLAVGYGQP
jgi:hypothetical protein